MTERQQSPEQCTAVHCFGLHLGAVEWRQRMWLASDGRLGQMPMALLVALDKDATFLSIGTGASEKDGLKEAEWTRQFALAHLDELREHPLFQSVNFTWVWTLLTTAFADTKSQNTVQEIILMSDEYAVRGVTEVYAVTNPSHAPRCRRELDIHISDAALRRQTYVVSSEVPFAGAAIGDTVIMEPPHRGDDTSPPFYRLIPRIFRLAASDKAAFYEKFDQLLNSFGV